MPAKIHRPLPEELTAQWHPTKNGGLAAEDVSTNSKDNAWWMCAEGHEWEAQIHARSRGNGCPYCSGRRVLTGITDLATVAPALAAQWHPTRNGDLLPTQVVRNTTKKVWWQCDKGHEWEGSIINRGDGAGCPVCSNALVQTGINDLATTRPDLVPLWHSTKNGVKTPYTVAHGQPKRWWLCEQGHEWQASSISLPVAECPVCSGKKIVAGINGLTVTHPQVAALWDEQANSSNVAIVSHTSSAQAHWVDSKGHVWKRAVREMIANPQCPVCSGRILEVGLNDVATLYPELAAQWHPTKNELPQATVAKSYGKAWWVCQEGHEWKALVDSRIAGRGCPVCAGHKVVAGINDLASQYPELSEQWHPTKNGKAKPDAITPGSGKKAWWLCSQGHEWETVISSRTANASGCPVCSHRKFLTGFNDLATKSPAIAAQWHPTRNGDLRPSDVSNGANRKVWWQCAKGHEWNMSVVIRTSSGQSCPLCSGRKVVTGINDFATLYPELATQWHPQRNEDPLLIHNVSGQSNKSGWWQCDKGHEWKAKFQSRAIGNGCALCGNATSNAETQVADYIVSLLPSIDVQRRARDIIGQMELDIYIPEKKFAVEFNGLYWHSERQGKGRKYHYDKWQACQHLGIQLIQIWEDDWKNKPEVVKAMLAHKLGSSALPKIAGRKTTVSEITTDVASKFLEQNHIQGFASGSKYLALTASEGLVGGSAGHTSNNSTTTPEASVNASEGRVVVAVLVLRIENKDDKQVGNIVRYATSANVVGGFTKLLSFAERNYTDLSSVYTFSDNCVSDGGLYANTGFTKVRELAPDYMYLVQNERKHKFGYRLKRFRNDPELLWEEGLTERELAELNGFPRIWDAGKMKWEKSFSRD